MNYTVNQELLVQDYRVLSDKREQARTSAAMNAKAYAERAGWDEQHTAQFIDFAVKASSDGLNEQERNLLSLIGRYIVINE